MGKRFRSLATATVLTGIGALTLAGGALAAFPGMNGKIVYAHNPGPPFNNDLFTIDPNGANPMQLTSGPGRDFQPAYSADGERIVFMRNDAGTSEYHVWAVNFDGTGETQLTSDPGFTDRDPYWFPDGKRIAFVRGVNNLDLQIFVMNADGSEPTQLTFPGPAGDQSSNPSVSPDGQKIAFLRSDGATGYAEIWVMNADGSGQTRLTAGSATLFDEAPDWSPDGQRIVFDRYDDSGPGDGNVFVMGADGSGQTPITSGDGVDFAPAFSPDGTLVAFERENATQTFGNITATSPNGLDLGTTPLTNNSAPVFDFEPNWQPLNPPDCGLSGKATSKTVKRVIVTVTCDNENATVVAEGSGKAPKVPKAAAIASKAKKFTIPPVTIQAQQGTATAVTLKIPKKGVKALKKATKAGKKGKAAITATLSDELGQSSTATFSVKFKAKRK